MTILLPLNGLGFEANTSHGARSCSPTHVKGLQFCPQLANLMPMLLENKRALLRLALDALTGVRVMYCTYVIVAMG